MQQLPNSTLGSFWSRLLGRTPLPVRLLAVIWLAASVGFDVSSPQSTANLPALVSFIILLPTAIMSLGLGLYVFWRGGKTIYSTVLSVTAQEAVASTAAGMFATVIGGLGALQIYMVLYLLLAFWVAKVTGDYGLSLVLSIILAVAIGYALFARKPHPKDVRFFLIGGLLITALFGIIMATVAAPPT